ncbi:MAG TPA: LapA family protein [Virgibacillus sp.]|nr:LapA family protein [Virgibacillus sp.]
MKGQTYVILSIIVLIIVSVFAVSNVDAVNVNYLFWQGHSPLILVILFSVLMGGVITAMASSLRYFRLKRENKSLQIRNKKLEDLLSKHGIDAADAIKGDKKSPDLSSETTKK